jgi:hypothetical protein
VLATVSSESRTSFVLCIFDSLGILDALVLKGSESLFKSELMIVSPQDSVLWRYFFSV